MHQHVLIADTFSVLQPNDVTHHAQVLRPDIATLVPVSRITQLSDASELDRVRYNLYRILLEDHRRSVLNRRIQAM